MPDTTPALVAQDAQVQVTQAEQTPVAAPEFKWQFQTGTVYKDDAALVQGVVEKDVTIARLKAALEATRAATIQSGVHQPNGVNQVPQVNAQVQRMVQAEFSTLVRKFPNTEQSDLQAMAEYNVESQLGLENRILEKFQATNRSQQWQGQYEGFKANELKNGVNLDFDPIYDSVVSELPGQSPEVHYSVWKNRRSANGSQMPTNASTTAAADMYQRSMNTGGVGTSGTQASNGADHPYVFQQVEMAKKSGKPADAVERVRQRAIENLPAVLKTGARF